MGYINDLKKCSNANDYQNVFDNEVRRLMNLTILRNDDQKLSERVNRLKKEIEDVMKVNGLKSELKVFDFKKSNDLKTKFISKLKDVRFYKDLMFMIAPFVLVLGLMLTLLSIYQLNKVDGHSMDPTLSDKSYLIVNKYAKLNRFDVVVAKELDSEGKPYSVVKRIIGMPGDVIEYKNDVLYVNGTETDEPHIKQYLDSWKENRLDKEYSYDSDLQAKSLLSLGFTTQDKDLITKELNPDPSVFKVEVPLTGYFLIGDNRIVSRDSREVGAFPRENIVGKVIWNGFG
jgi:signal peptidase I